MSSPVSSNAGVRSSTGSVTDRQSGRADLGPEPESIGAAEFEVVVDRAGGGKVSAAEKWLARRMFQAMGSPPVRLVLPGGQQIDVVNAIWPNNQCTDADLQL